MGDNWYYVVNNNRQGPVGMDLIESLLAKNELTQEDFVWKKGFDNWKKIKDVDELRPKPKLAEAPSPKTSAPAFVPPTVAAAVVTPQKVFSLKDLGQDERSVYIRIGNDRGGEPSDYGPFSLNQIKQLFKENRINGKTFIFSQGMGEWKVLADLPDYQEIFEELPPLIQEADRRTSQRKPFVARLFVQNNKKVFEGICRDISIGGMQILMDNFAGKAGDKISINVHPENSDYHFTAAGIVVRMLDGNSGFSFRFQGLNDEAKRAIEKYVQEN